MAPRRIISKTPRRTKRSQKAFDNFLTRAIEQLSNDVRESSEVVSALGFGALSVVMTTEVVGPTQSGPTLAATPSNSAPIRKRWSHLWWPKIKNTPAIPASTLPPPPPSSPSPSPSLTEEEELPAPQSPVPSTAPITGMLSRDGMAVSQED